jgi:hypothetical protein
MRGRWRNFENNQSEKAIVAIVFILALQLSGCATQLYQGAPLPEAQVVRLMTRNPVRDQPGQLVLGIISLGLLNWGSWEVGLNNVDGKLVLAGAEMLPGVHTASATASQGATGSVPLGGQLAIWRCKGSIEFDVPPGSYELAFNYNKDNPQFRIDDKASGTTVAVGPCNRVSVWTDREIKKEGAGEK